jgi:hypothetical protein
MTKNGKHRICLAERLGILRKDIVECGGLNPAIFLDTGFFIDSENIVRAERSYDRRASFAMFANELYSLGKPIVTDGIYDEIKNHSDFHYINGRVELSQLTVDFANACRVNFYLADNLLRGRSKLLGYQREITRYVTHWTSLASFADDHKKGCVDCISCADKDLISDALLFSQRKIGYRHAFGLSRNFSGVVIISSDSHVYGTIKTLKGQNPDALRRMGIDIGENGEVMKTQNNGRYGTFLRGVMNYAGGVNVISI